MSRPDAKPSLQGSFRLFQVFGISVYLHWSWLVVAYYEIQYRAGDYGSQAWNIAEYVGIFVIVLLHEFGHALACRQVGGRANEIVLWPLGGIAFVSPPPRPGAFLWSIAAGPLVNVALVPVTLGAWLITGLPGPEEALSPDFRHFLGSIALINGIMLAFNMLPIYPLDGGQILQALLWFVIGRARSLLVVSIIGMVAGVGALVLAVVVQSVWIGVIAVFAAIRSISGFQQAQLLARLENAPRHEDAACPSCKTSPVMGKFWLCDQCETRFDTFRHGAMCPSCGKQFAETGCPSCGARHPLAEWFQSVEAAPLDGRERE
jgi:Zn-dependent protease